MRRPSASASWGAAVATATGLLYLRTLAPGAFWLDSSELVAAAHTLGVPHPPGEPVWLVLAKALSLAPIANVTARVNLLSALCGVIAVLAVYGLGLRAARGADRSRDAWLAPAAALGALVVGASPAFWFQSIRAEVYTLHLALVLGAAWLLAPFGEGPAPPDPTDPTDPTGPNAPDGRGAPPHAARVPLAAFLVGLALGNHHFLVVLALPALLWLAFSHPAGRTWLRPGRLALLVAIGLLALAPYAVLPLRARLDPAVNWGDASTLGGFVDVVTARVFQASIDPAARAGVSVVDNLVTAFALFLDHLTPPVALAGLAGLALVVRRRPRLGVALVLLLVGSVLSKALMFLDPENPDDHGYFAAAMAVLALGAGVLLGAGAAAARRALRGRLQRAALAGALMAVVLGVPAWQVARYADANDLSTFRSPTVVLQATLEAVPPGAILMPYYYAFQFALWHGQYVEERRPDVAVVNQTFQANLEGGAPLRRWLRRAYPKWEVLADAWERAGGFPSAEVVEWSRGEAIYVEPFTESVVPPANLESVGLLARVRPHPVPTSGAAADRSRAHRGLYWISLLARLGDEVERFPHTHALLLWYTYLEAALQVQRGDRTAAAEAIERGLALAPASPRLLELRATLDR